jgi:hypothetical protein
LQGGLGVPSPSGSTCLGFWVNGGTPSFAHAVSGTLNLAAIVAPETTTVQDLGIGWEFTCTTSGCTINVSGQPSSESGTAYYFATASTLDYIWGDVSDATYPLPAPTGSWSTTNNLYLVNSADCCPGCQSPYWIDYVPPGSTLLASFPQSGNGDGVGEQTVFQSLNYPIPAGDCIFLITGVSTDPGNAKLDNELQIHMVITPN